ncbi:uracil-DNA glycosylase [Chrysiogenes arsenatis]|uniref:uracil-DNA glycosylase n=1 Tax=Chrysiogenes arsenatis TaxID=309797 RepID=UPI001F182E2E|nr:uracil-DNA glycosylase [Chrysiogenes arsenatis]
MRVAHTPPAPSQAPTRSYDRVPPMTTKPAAQTPPKEAHVLAIPENDSWEQLERDLADCQGCKLATLGRSSIVIGAGNRHASICLVGEGPGFEEDRQGKPFVGASGQKLDQIMRAIGWQRDELYICNVIKCRPPQNRDPQLDEMTVCAHFLKRQLALLKPTIILALGRFAGNFFWGTMATPKTMNQMRQKILSYHSAKVICTYHPSALLRNETLRRPVWEDVRALHNLHSQLKGEALKYNKMSLIYPEVSDA